MRRVVVAALTALVLAVPAQAGGGWFITGYCLRGHTATGTIAGPMTVAVDPHVIPLHSRVWIDGNGPFRALDTGVYGHHVDVWVSNCSDAYRITHHNGSVRWQR